MPDDGNALDLLAQALAAQYNVAVYDLRVVVDSENKVVVLNPTCNPPIERSEYLKGLPLPDEDHSEYVVGYGMIALLIIFCAVVYRLCTSN